MIDQKKAKELAIEYIKNKNIIDYPPDLENVRIYEDVNSWTVHFRKICPKGTGVLPAEYIIDVNKETGEAKFPPYSLK